MNIQWIRSRLGLVTQEPTLFDLSIIDNITYGLENISFDAVVDAAIKANIHEFIKTLPDVCSSVRKSYGTLILVFDPGLRDKSR